MVDHRKFRAALILRPWPVPLPADMNFKDDTEKNDFIQDEIYAYFHGFDFYVKEDSYSISLSAGQPIERSMKVYFTSIEKANDALDRQFDKPFLGQKMTFETQEIKVVDDDIFNDS